MTLEKLYSGNIITFHSLFFFFFSFLLKVIQYYLENDSLSNGIFAFTERN